MTRINVTLEYIDYYINENIVSIKNITKYKIMCKFV